MDINIPLWSDIGSVDMVIDFTKMCDRCYKAMDMDEDWFGFKVTDDFGVERMFKGHEYCVKKMAELIRGEYGEDNDENLQ
jgi:hypothetical protein